MSHTAAKRDAGRALREKAQEAALRAAERLCALVSDPEASNADALRAAALIFERVYPGQAAAGGGGDFEICVKGE